MTTKSMYQGGERKLRTEMIRWHYPQIGVIVRSAEPENNVQSLHLPIRAWYKRRERPHPLPRKRWLPSLCPHPSNGGPLLYEPASFSMMAHDCRAAHFLNVLIPASFQILLKVLYLHHGIALNLRGKPKRHAFLSLFVKGRNTKRKIYDPLNMRKAPLTRPGLLDQLANEPPKVLRACGM
jgi:hypothetical protein